MSNKYMKPTAIWAGIVTALLLVLTSGPVMANSLWPQSGPAGLYQDHQARAVGDILTIVISEASSATRSGSANNTKSASADLTAGVGIFRGVMGGTTSDADSFKAQGAITNTNNVSGKLTVMITEVKPNGNLVISGTQSIKQNGEEQKITVSGEVRPEDISADNTVLSSYVSNAQIRIDGKGPLASKQRQGILTQLFNFLW
jgi:flagellar L-ring protein FlgH